MPAALIIHNIGFLICAVLIVSIIALVWVKDRHTKGNKLFMLGMASIFVWVVTHVIGVNIADPVLAREVFTWHISIIFISAYFAHFIFVFLGREREQRVAIWAIYAFSIGISAVYLVWPDTLILTPHPKLYFPNYYVAGSLHWVMSLGSNVIIPGYFLIYMAMQYRRQTELMKERIKYLFFSFLFGYSLGGLGIPLVFTDDPTYFGILIDPVYSIFFIPFFSIPFTYAALKYDVLDIRIVAKRAFVYAVAVAVCGSAVALLQYANELVIAASPSFPYWLLPLASSIIGVTIGFLVWRRLREADALKYEFITVVTHKFRTPLTEIRWATDALAPSVPEDKGNVDQIKKASARLIDLTGLLVEVSEADAADFDYRTRPGRLGEVVDGLKEEYRRRAGLKGISISFEGSSAAESLMDESQTRFAVQTLLDNAVSYTPKGGVVKASLKEEQGNVLFAVSDSGIGFSKEELGRLFQKFWRSQGAHKMDTEGMGIGLFIARRAMERQKGDIWAKSPGPGLGSTFYLRLPVKR